MEQQKGRRVTISLMGIGGAPDAGGNHLLYLNTMILEGNNLY